MEQKSNTNVHREITPLTQNDCLLVFDRIKTKFDFPTHFHSEYELNFVHDGTMAQRIVGNHIEFIDDFDLVLTGPNLPHGWHTGKWINKEMREITIQFHQDLFSPSLLQRNVMQPIEALFQKSLRGIRFPKEVAIKTGPRMKAMVNMKGAESFLELINILLYLADSEQYLLSSDINQNEEYQDNDPLKEIYCYIQANFHHPIKLEDIASVHNMTTITFGRLIKRRTGKTFVEFLNNIRIGHATRKLLETDISIAEIAFTCGFNNLANFNRIFKKFKGCSPTQYKENFIGTRTIH